VRYEEANFAFRFAASMQEMRKEGKLCDVIIKVADRRFSAHRLVLAASIPYFRSMFTLGMAEENQEEIGIDESSIDAVAMEAYISFAYNGKLLITLSNVQSLVTGACFLQLTAIKEECCKFMQNNIHVTNCFDILKFADTFLCESLHTETKKFLRKSFSDFVLSSMHLALPFEDFLMLIKDDGLNVSSEEVVYDAVVSWVEHDRDNRSQYVAQLMSCVRFPLLRPPFLSDVVSCNELIKSSHECRDLVDEAKDFYLIPERRASIDPMKLRGRCCKELQGHIYVIGGLTSAGDSVNFVEHFDCVTEKWVPGVPTKLPRSRLGVTVHNNSLYAIGGYDGCRRLDSVEKFSLPECHHPGPTSSASSSSTGASATAAVGGGGGGQWEMSASLNTKRSVLCAVVVKDTIIVVGGYNGIASLNTIELYNPAEDEGWRMGSPMLKARSATGCCVLDNRFLFAIGGHDGLSIFKSVEMLDIESHEWVMVAPMMTKRCRHGAAVLNGRIYVCGGYDGSKFLNSCEVYDQYPNAWSTIAPMIHARSRVSVVSNGGKLYALGGFDGASNLSSVEVYDPESNTWSITTSMLCHEGGIGAAVLPFGSK